MNISDRIGISTNILDNSEYLFSSLEGLSERFRTVEIEFDNEARPYLMKPESEVNPELERVLALKESRGLYFSVHAPYIGRSTDISNPDEAQREQAVDLMKRTIRLTAKLGATRMTCHPGYLTKDPELQHMLFGQLKKSLVQLTDEASQYGIDICLENTGDKRPNYIVLNDEEQEELCTAFGVFMTMDIVHFTSFHGMDRDYYERLKPMVKWIKNVHFADMVVPNHVHLPLGSGDFKYQDAIAFLNGAGYTGNFIVEERGAKFTEADYLDAAFHYRSSLA
ncbi:sugar phosphate isomerase/epimerase family protein [Caballeronia sp. LZ034LL]|uniref:sugar phosphate isomerase/epimerase family protein n=1 Tax=Caballeronia sp. LZ034LL TaxID=3038567 RepID=UPI002858D4EF|nr:sugar phosphate isomerase/epimerase family protein [Caballeronia sp. LZ034LL]MDR5836658.1 sugar phosphate isomerase/epimerase [Caballeronia sp. LZ034LL]